ncbi:hypothetical protein L218DRAFT_1007176 [Marasmius fiardii PR-910]|nr:hypothetical protein L218DRAFT_1007176 [Marasmius fiardii PR-910]
MPINQSLEAPIKSLDGQAALIVAGRVDEAKNLKETHIMAPETFKYHDNEVDFQLAVGSTPIIISSGSFTVTSFMISSGQDPDHRNRIGDVHTFTANTVQDQKFVFTCGRHGTSEVANFWNTNIPPYRNTFGHTAGDLNFAFLGTLVLTVGPYTVTFTDIGLAQGHDNTSNNWWFGGKNCVRGNGNIVTCTGTDQNGMGATFTFARGNPLGIPVNLVNITAISFGTE